MTSRIYVLRAGLIFALVGCATDSGSDAETSGGTGTADTETTTSLSGPTSGGTTTTGSDASTSGTTGGTTGGTGPGSTDGGSSTGGEGACGDGMMDPGESCDDAGASESCTADCYLVGERLWAVEHSPENGRIEPLDLAATPDRIHAVGRRIPTQPASWGGWAWVLDGEGTAIDEPIWESEYGAELHGVIALDGDHIWAGTFAYGARVARGQDGGEDWGFAFESPSEAWDVARVGDELWVSGWAVGEGRWIRRLDAAGKPLASIPVSLEGSGSGTRLAAAAGVVVVEENPGVCRYDTAGELGWCAVPSNEEGRASNVAVASDGSIIVTGWTEEEPTQAFVQRYEPGGEVSWLTPLGPGETHGVVVDDLGHIIVSGRDSEMAAGCLAQIDLETGAVQWEVVETEADPLFAVAVGEAGRLTALGPSTKDPDGVFLARYAF